MEIWKDIYFVQDGEIFDYRGKYQVSNKGNIKSLTDNHGQKREKIMKPRINKNGYFIIGLSKNSKQKTFKIHRLVAHMFIKGYFKNAQVNHKDENKTNNHVENLEWCNAKYNVNYGARNEKTSEANRGRLVARYSLDGELIDIKYQCEYKQMGFEQGNVSDCCNGKRKTHKGFVFKYWNDGNDN